MANNSGVKEIVANIVKAGPKRGYVLGFLFDKDKVVLIRKNRPFWMRGKLNGVGGKIEEGETAKQAMVREFREETSVDTDPSIWKHFVTMTSDTLEVICYCAEGDASGCITNTDEKVLVVDKTALGTEDCLDNVKWLLEMALVSFNPDNPIDHLNVTFVRPAQLTDLVSTISTVPAVEKCSV
jgi:8-oxo-dGTP diphosphatase